MSGQASDGCVMSDKLHYRAVAGQTLHEQRYRFAAGLSWEYHSGLEPGRSCGATVR